MISLWKQGLVLAEHFTLLQTSNHMPRLECTSVSVETPNPKTHSLGGKKQPWRPTPASDLGLMGALSRWSSRHDHIYVYALYTYIYRYATPPPPKPISKPLLVLFRQVLYPTAV